MAISESLSEASAYKPKVHGKYWTPMRNALCSASFEKHFLPCIIKKTAGQKEMVGLSSLVPNDVNLIASVSEDRFVL